VGHGKKAVVIQFLKWRKDIGEVQIKDYLGDLYEIHHSAEPHGLAKNPNARLAKKSSNGMLQTGPQIGGGRLLAFLESLWWSRDLRCWLWMR
jgi:ATP:corrinoid adenosyltransferase